MGLGFSLGFSGAQRFRGHIGLCGYIRRYLDNSVYTRACKDIWQGNEGVYEDIYFEYMCVMGYLGCGKENGSYYRGKRVVKHKGPYMEKVDERRPQKGVTKSCENSLKYAKFAKIKFAKMAAGPLQS